MGYPTISQYAESVADPYGLTRSLPEFEAERDIYGKVRLTAGNNAVVFRINYERRQSMLKCYIKPPVNAIKIYDYIKTNPDQMLTEARLLPQELFVYDIFGQGAFYDVVVCDWMEGNTLGTEIKRAVGEGDTSRLGLLADVFNNLAADLLSREWAHGDLKSENIIVGEDGEMTLIDYDAMFIPELAGTLSCETGTPGFQHPVRDENYYNKHIDDYPVTVISVSLHALALDPSLYNRYNTSDNIILHPEEVIGGSSVAYDEILDLFARSGRHDLYHLAMQLRSPDPAIPGLKSIIAACLGKSKDEGSFTSTVSALRPVFENGLWGYEDLDGNTIMPTIYQAASEFSEGLAVVSLKGILQMIDMSGRAVINNETFAELKPFSCGLAAVRLGDKWGYINKAGKITIDPVFDMAASMREGIAVVKTNGKYGYIDTCGNILTEPLFDYAQGFRSGRAVAGTGSNIFEIDLHGNIKAIESIGQII